MDRSPPKITLVTPSFNQGEFLRDNLESVRTQTGVEIEHIVMDGGSTDDSVSIIQQHAAHLAYWQCQKDGGQTDALIQGFKRATGEVFGWLNSDDYLWEPQALRHVVEAFAEHPEADLVTGDMVYVTRDRKPILMDMTWKPTGDDLRYFMAIPQQSTFWRRSAYERVGGLNLDLHFCMDFDLFQRMSEKGKIIRIPHVISAFRLQRESKTYKMKEIHRRERARCLLRSLGRESPGARGAMKGLRLRAESLRAELDAILKGRKLPTYANARIELMSFFVLLRHKLRA